MSLVDLTVSKVNFTKRYLATSRRIANEIVQDMPLLGINMSVESLFEDATRSMVLEMRSWILEKEHDELDKIEYTAVPKTWWDHFKLEVINQRFPWVKRWFPIQWDKIEVEHVYRTAKVCPHANVKWSNDRAVHVGWLTEIDEG